jgi:hypothetical protein
MSVPTIGDDSGVDFAVVCVDGGKAPSRLCTDFELIVSITESDTLFQQ